MCTSYAKGLGALMECSYAGHWYTSINFMRVAHCAAPKLANVLSGNPT